jgi:hypothetical protein
MICKQCQNKISRKCVKACGGTVPLNALGCDNDYKCEWESFADGIIKIFKNKENMNANN